MMFARVHGLELSFGERVRTFLYRGWSRNIILDDDDDWQQVSPTTAAQPLVVATTARADYPGRYRVSDAHRTLTAYFGDKGEARLANVRIEFFRVAVTRPGEVESKPRL